MQVVALSGYSVDETTVRVPLVSMADVISATDIDSRITSDVVKDEAPPGNPAFLQICSLRC